MICKLEEEFFASISSGLGEVLCGRGLDFWKRRAMADAYMELYRDTARAGRAEEA